MSSEFYRRIEVRCTDKQKVVWRAVSKGDEPDMRIKVGDAMCEILTVYWDEVRKEQIPEGETIA